ncbi:Uncharacterized protein FWK35_00031053, partial [Aphis craccivora]
ENPNGKRLISTPGVTGGAIPLIPIFAGLLALGSLMSGNANEKKTNKKDVSSANGIHWVALYKIKDKVVYFDSFGDFPPPIELQNYFKGNIIIYNYSNYQDFNSFNCVTLSLTSHTTTLSVHYFPSIDVYDDSEIALLNLQTYNTFPNINETNNQFEIYLENPDRLLNNNKFPTCLIALKKECYGIKDIKN